MRIKLLLEKFLLSLLLVFSSHLLVGFKKPIIPPQPALNQSKVSALPSTKNITADTTAVNIPKLTPLDPIPFTTADPLLALDSLVTKQHRNLKPYTPLIQEVFIGVNYGMLFMDIWQSLLKLKNQGTQQEYQYESSLGLLLRKNILLSSNLGYEQLHPNHTFDNPYPYTVQGIYGRIGLGYRIRYSTRDNLSIGLRYARSHFTHTSKPNKLSEPIEKQALKASWFEIVIGAESKLWEDYNLYAGLSFHLKSLYQATKPALYNNYVIPGYGRNKNKTTLALSLYIQYNLSFLNRLITLN